MKRVCFVTKFIKGVHSGVGGMETHVDDLLKELKKDQDYDISIITSKHPEGVKYQKKKNIKIYYVDKTIGRSPFSRYSFFKSIIKKLKELKQSSFDVIHIQSDFGMGYFQYIGKKTNVITTAHGTTINEFKGSVKAKPYLIIPWLFCLPFYYLSEKNMIKNSDKIICVSDVVKKALVSQYFVKRKNKFKTILNGVDLKYFKKKNDKKTKNLRSRFANKDDFLIISVGKIIKQKGYHLIVEAMPKILEKNPNIKVLIVGDGDYLEKLKRLSKKKKLDKNIFFTGKIPREDLVRYYSAADCFAFPTLRGEGLPYVLIEAMACDDVLLTTPNGGTDLVTKKNGVLIDVKNKKSIIDSVLKLSSSKDYYNKLLIESKKDVKEKCDIKKMVEENKKVYRGIMKK